MTMNTWHRSLIGAGVLTLGAALSAAPVAAATATSSMLVSATVLSFCTVAALPMTFGNYSNAQLDATATITATCTATTPYTVGLGAGAGSGATITDRKMTNGAVTLSYALYNNSGRTTNWGDTSGTGAVVGTGSGLPQLLTVYGRIPADQFATTGAYLDTVAVTLTY